MHKRLFATLGVVALASAILSGQATKKYAPPRQADGHPDLSGTYDVATLTPVERPANTPAVISDEAAAKLEKDAAARMAAGDVPIKGDRDAPPKGGDGSVGPAGNVGGYNTFWLDPGSHYSVVNGQRRASIVVDPPTGRVPALTDQARQRMASRIARPTSDVVARENDP